MRLHPLPVACAFLLLCGFTLGKHRGREFEVMTLDRANRCRARLYLVGNRLYQVFAIIAGRGKLPKDVERFHKSFRLSE